MEYDVTIGIPVFRTADCIEKTMQSVLCQTFPNIEFLIIDDCGEDGSISVITRFQNEHLRGEDIRIIKNDRNYGVGYCRNRIIDEAKGRYLYFLDSDDLIEPYTIELLYDSIRRHRAEVSYGSYKIIDCLGNTPTEEVYQKPSMVITKDNELAVYAFKNAHVFHISVCNCLMDLAFLRKTGIRFINALFWEDMAFTYELVPKVRRAVLLSDITYHYLRRAGSLSHYQVRDSFEKKEIMKNAAVIDAIKKKCIDYKGKDYLPYLCYNLEIDSFYVVCHILKHFRCIAPKIRYTELREIIAHPLLLSDILGFKRKLLPNLLFWLLGSLPMIVYIPSIWFMGRVKRAI